AVPALPKYPLGRAGTAPRGTVHSAVVRLGDRPFTWIAWSERRKVYERTVTFASSGRGRSDAGPPGQRPPGQGDLPGRANAARGQGRLRGLRRWRRHLTLRTVPTLGRSKALHVRWPTKPRPRCGGGSSGTTPRILRHAAGAAHYFFNFFN